MAVKAISPGDKYKEFDAYGTEDDEPVKNIKQPFKKFALGQGRGHQQSMEEDEDDDDGDENEDSDEGSEAESYYLGFNTREEMDAFLEGKKLG